MNKNREKQTRYLSQAIQLEEGTNPHLIRLTMVMVSLSILVFLTWAALTNINEVARTPGEVVPQGYQQTVQHFEGGMVKKVHVHEGDIVKEQDILVTLYDAIIKKDLERAQNKQLSLNVQAERLRAFIDGREPDFSQFNIESPDIVTEQQSFFSGMKDARTKEEKIVKDQIQQRRQSLQTWQDDLDMARNNLIIVQDIHQRRKVLNQKGYASDMQILEDKKRLNDISGEINRLENKILMTHAEIREFKGRLASLTATQRDDINQRLDIILAEKSQNQDVIDKLKERMDRLEVRSPSRGLVKGVTVNTVGAVIKPGQTLMEIVPLDKDLEIQVKISPKDVGHLKIGQPVQIKFSSFDFSRYGSVKGQLEQISATTFADDQGGRYYQGRVLLAQEHVGSDKKNRIIPGMTVMADIITGKKTILQYLLKPIHTSLKTAFSER